MIRTGADKTAEQIMAGIEVTNGYAQITSREITKTEKTEEKDTVFVKLVLNETGWNLFWENVSVSIKNKDADLVGNPVRTSTGVGMNTEYKLTVNLKFEMSHVHSVDLVRGTPKTCTTAGQKDYYECACGAVFEDADHSKPISELDTWKVIPAGHEYGELREQEEKHETNKLQPAVEEHYYCELCKKYFNPDKTETTLEALTGETPRHQ